MVSKDSYCGCLLGLALGDALCAPHEGGPLERLLWRAIGKTRAGEYRYTDDTQMSLDVARSLLEHSGVDQDHLAGSFAGSYRWSRGYGPSAGKLLKSIGKGRSWQDVNRGRFPEGSFGNGAAMRAPVVGLFFYGNNSDLLRANRQVAEITHAHPWAIEGARLIALSTAAALSALETPVFLKSLVPHCESDRYRARLQTATHWLEQNEPPGSKTVARQLGNGIAALDSCITAIYIALRHRDNPFLEMLNFIRQCGGDTDTIASMAGAIWGALNGSSALEDSGLHRLEDAAEIREIAGKLYGLAPNKADAGTEG